jgi:hypothetical protein
MYHSAHMKREVPRAVHVVHLGSFGLSPTSNPSRYFLNTSDGLMSSEMGYQNLELKHIVITPLSYQPVLLTRNKLLEVLLLSEVCKIVEIKDGGN